MFARKGRLPVDINTENQHEPDNKVKDFFAADEPDEEQIAGKREEMNALAKLNIQKAQQKQKQYYDKKHGAASCFTTGAVVLKKDFRRKKRRGGKLGNGQTLARSVCHNCFTRQTAVSIAGSWWTKGGFLLTTYVAAHSTSLNGACVCSTSM